MFLPLILISACFSPNTVLTDEAPALQPVQQEMHDPHAPPPLAPPLDDAIVDEYTRCCCVGVPAGNSLFRNTRKESRLLNAAVQAMRVSALQGPGISSCAICESDSDLQEHYCRSQAGPAGRPDSDHPKICKECKDRHCLCPFCAGPKFQRMPEHQQNAQVAQPLLPANGQQDLPICARYCCNPILHGCGAMCGGAGACGVEFFKVVLRTCEWIPFCIYQPCNGCSHLLCDCGARLGRACGACGACLCSSCRVCGDYVGNECRACSGLCGHQCSRRCSDLRRRYQRAYYNGGQNQNNPPQDLLENGYAA